MLEELLPMAIRILGEKHVGILMTESNLAQAYCLCNEWERAVAVFRKAIPTLHPEHPDWAHAMCGHVRAQSKLDQPPQTLENDCYKVIDAVHSPEISNEDNARALGTAQVLLGPYESQGRSEDIKIVKAKIPGLEKLKDGQDVLLNLLYGCHGHDEDTNAKPSLW